VLNWTGDVREDLSDYIKYSQFCITLFSNETNVIHFKNLNLKSEFLQVGYDHHYYYNTNSPRKNQIVFCANHYPHINFPLTNYRAEVASAMKYHFGEKFILYGYGWDKLGLKSEGIAKNVEEARVYNESLLAINLSHFNYKRYFSDRMLREMACGAMVLTHRFEDCEIDFKNNEHFVIWENIEDLVKKCEYYLSNPEECQRISTNGTKEAEENYKWSIRVNEFINIINKYK
jgi:glycosyltransferase involved in cell wall biosynthesis